MTKHITYPWRDERSLAETIAAARPWMRRRRIVKPGGGYGDADLAAAEKRLGRPLPPDVRQFYQAVRPVRLFSDEGPEEFGFYQPGQRELKWMSMDGAEPAGDFARAEGLAIGQSLAGDGLWWVKGHRAHGDGCILLFDHELAFGDVQFLIIARSLKEFVGKVLYFKGLDPRGGGFDDDLDLMDEDDGDEGGGGVGEDAEEPDAGLFFREYAELNPATKRWKQGQRR